MIIIRSLFFNSINGDRRYRAEDFASYFSKILTNGVFPNSSSNLQVLEKEGMKITVKAGGCNINGYFGINDIDEVLTCSVANPMTPRTDIVVARWSLTNREITLVIKHNTIALTRTADTYEICLAEITIPAGAASISQANIKDTRQDTSKCGLVNSLITADSTTLFKQFEAQFNNWFNDIKGKLNTDIAGSLQVQIDKKFEIFLSENLPDIAQRKSNVIYCKITDKVEIGGGNTTIRVSPNLGIKV